MGLTQVKAAGLVQVSNLHRRRISIKTRICPRAAAASHGPGAFVLEGGQAGGLHCFDELTKNDVSACWGVGDLLYICDRYL